VGGLVVKLFDGINKTVGSWQDAVTFDAEDDFLALYPTLSPLS